ISCVIRIDIVIATLSALRNRRFNVAIVILIMRCWSVIIIVIEPNSYDRLLYQSLSLERTYVDNSVSFIAFQAM
ncbi:hypothetical protein, partial [Metapseudomonas otitidis]|uniref:hypothetical protein n=1 Tax=Metapseudomonas otitidis TaxID=319939 RepID=UPI001F1798E1